MEKFSFDWIINLSIDIKHDSEHGLFIIQSRLELLKSQGRTQFTIQNQEPRFCNKTISMIQFDRKNLETLFLKNKFYFIRKKESSSSSI